MDDYTGSFAVKWMSDMAEGFNVVTTGLRD